MYRVKAYRPNLRKGSYGKVKTHQWSEKPTPVGIEYALDKMAYEGRYLDEKITELHVIEYRGKIGGIWIQCSKPQYKWDRGFHSFMVYFRPKKRDLLKSWDEEKEDENQALIKFLEGCEKFFKENDLDVKIFGDDPFTETSIGELISQYQ